MTDVFAEVNRSPVQAEFAGPGQVSDHGRLIGRGDDDHTQYALLAGRSGDRHVVNSASASTAPMQWAPQSAEPTSPATNDIYLDDGTNTRSGREGFRRYNGSTWEDLVASADFAAATELTISSGGITVTQGSHKLQPESGTVDDLDTISGLAAGEWAIFYVSDAGTDTISWKHATDNISVIGGGDISHSTGAVLAYSDGTTVYVIGGGGVSGGATANTETVTLSSHGHSVGMALKDVSTAGSGGRSLGDTAANSAFYGIVSAVPDTNNFTVTLPGGKITLTTAQWDARTGETGGLTAGEYYVIDHSTAGDITKTASTTANEINRVVLYAESTTEAIVLHFIAEEVSDPVTAFSRDHIAGLNVNNNTTDADHDIDVREGEARDADNTADLTLSSKLVKQIDATWAVGNNAGGRLSGTLDADSAYGVWLIKNSTSGVVDVGIEKDKTLPTDSITFPSGYDKARLIWVVYTDSSSNILNWLNFGDGGMTFEEPQADVADTTITDEVEGQATMSVPPNCTGIFNVAVKNSNSDNYAVTIKYPAQNTDIGGANRTETSIASTFDAASAGTVIGAAREMHPVDKDSILKYLAEEDAGTTEVYITTLGWIMDTRRFQTVKPSAND